MADIAAWLKMTPHFCDVDYDTLGMRADDARTCINKNTALILAPHPIVNLCDIDGLLALSAEYKIPLLFDSVEASFAEHNGRKVGSFGGAECFSMHASKFLNGFEGGYVTTNDDQLARKLRLIRNNGINVETGRVEGLGIDGKLIEPHAAMTLACLDEMDAQIERNKARFLKYKDELAGIEGITLMEYSLAEKRSFKNILVRLGKGWPVSRDLTLKILQAENMVVRPYYFPPLHKKKNEFPTVNGTLTNTEMLMEQLMLLPCGDFVSLQDIETVAAYLKHIRQNADAIAKELVKKHE
jgi:dTDP-4-amino-4,6-dideoxygalactose transaminase